SSALYTGATIFQVRMWRENARQTGEQSDKLILAARRIDYTTSVQAEDARKASTEALSKAERITKPNEELVKAAQTQANTSQVSARAAQTSADAATRSADIAAQSMQYASRAYVAVKEASLSAPIDSAASVIASVVYVNKGSTPARNVKTRIYVNYFKG